MQLLEPIYIWIGAPLAITLYFLEPLIAAYKRRRQLLRLEMDKINQDLAELRAIETPQKAAEAALKAVGEMIDLIADFFSEVVGPMALLFKLMREFLLPALKRLLEENMNTGNADQLRSLLIRFTSRLTLGTRSVTAFLTFGSRLLPLALLALALGLYTVFVYPVIPQSLGGGSPLWPVIVEAKKIPPDDENLQGLFPATEAEKADDAFQTKPDKPEIQVTCTVVLQYETDHAYYIRRDHGPIVAIDHDAVNGIISYQVAVQRKKVAWG